MKYYLQIGMVLLLIAAVASGVLAFVNSFTRPIIDENRRRAEDEARREVLPESIEFLKVESDYPFFIGLHRDGNLAGYTLLAEEMGYSGIIQTMVGVSDEMMINKIKIINQTETPGLGANITREGFTDQFSYLTIDELRIDKDGGEIETITGATITTRALTSSLRNALDKLEAELLKVNIEQIIDTYKASADIDKEELPGVSERELTDEEVNPQTIGEVE